MQKISAITAVIACAIGLQTLFLPTAHADETTKILVKKVDLGKKIAKNGIVDTKESLVFAAPIAIKGSKMRYARLCRYKTAKNGARLELEANISKLISKYLAEKGQKFNRAFPLQSELKSQKFIFSEIPSGLNGSQLKNEKAKLSKINQDFAYYLEGLCLKNKIPSFSVPLVYSPTHPAAVAALQAGGYLFYSADNAFLPQVVFTTGAKIKNLKQSDFVKLNPVLTKALKANKTAKQNVKDGKKTVNPAKAAKGENALTKNLTKPASSLQYLKYSQPEKSDLIDVSPPSVHVLAAGMSAPDYLWSETGKWITNPEDMSFSVGEMNPISYQIGTQFPEWGQMSTLYFYPSAVFSFALTPGLGESVMLNTIQVGGEDIAQINDEEGSGSVTVKWGGKEVSNLDQTIEGDGETKLEISLNWHALHYLRWHGAGINMDNGSSTGYGNLSIFHKTYFALDFIGYLNCEAKDTAEGIPLSATVTSVRDFDIPYTSSRSFAYVYTNGTPNAKGWGSSFVLNSEEVNNADSFGSPTPQTTDAGLWWKEEFPDESCNAKVAKGAKFTVATLADTLYTGPGSDPSSGKVLSNGEAYLEPAGGDSQNPLKDGPSGDEFAGWAFGSKPVEYSGVYTTSSPSGKLKCDLFEIGGIANGVYIVSQVASAQTASSSLPSFYITVTHNLPNSYSDTKDGINISYGTLDTSTGTIQILPFCKIKGLPLTGGKGVTQFLIPAFILFLTGGVAYGVCFWRERKRRGGY